MISFCTCTRSNLTITEYDHIDDISVVWDAIVPEGHSLKSIHLRILENSQLDDMTFKYLMVHKGGVLKGVVYLQHLNIKYAHFNGTAIDKPGLGWLKKCVNSQFSDVLICGNLFRVHFPGYFFLNSLDDPIIFEVLTEYLNSDKRNDKFCGVLVKDCLKPIEKTGKFKPYHDDVTMELDIDRDWFMFEDYQRALSKKYLQRSKKILKAAEALTIRELAEEDIVNQQSRIEALYLNVALKQSLRIGFVNAAYFLEMKRALGDSFVMTGYYYGDLLIGFSTYIYYPDNTMEIHFIGLDYDYNEKHSLYFNILFDGVKEGIATRSKRLELGRTARVAKASLGARPYEVHNYIYMRKGIPALAFSFFNTWFIKNLGEDWKDRNPFKQRALVEA